MNNRFVRVSRGPGGLWYLSGPPADGSFDPQAVPPDATGALLEAAHLLIAAPMSMALPATTSSRSGSQPQAMQEALNHLIILLVLLIPVLIVCAAAGGYFLVNRALRPVDRLSRTAEQLSLQNLTLRLPVLQSGDALERLSVSLNNMLGRLRDSVLTSRRFLADASHELRTPLTIIKGELQEVSRTTTLSSGDVRERVGSVLGGSRSPGAPGVRPAGDFAAGCRRGPPRVARVRPRAAGAHYRRTDAPDGRGPRSHHRDRQQRLRCAARRRASSRSSSICWTMPSASRRPAAPYHCAS